MKRNFRSLLPALMLLALPAAAGAETAIDSTTTVRAQQDRHPGFQNETLVPITQFLGVDMEKLGDGNLSAHFYGWGRMDVADSRPTLNQGDGSRLDGGFTYGYLQYRFKGANALVRAGRLFVTEGIVNEQLDGVSARTDLPYGFAVSGFGGATVHNVDVPGAGSDGKGEGVFGGRVNYRQGGLLDLGLSGIYESSVHKLDSARTLAGSFGSHRLVAGDIWLSPHNMVQFSGHSSYNTETESIAEHSYLLQVTPHSDVILTANYDERNDRDYFYSSVLFANMLRNLGQESRILGGSATYTFGKNTEISADFRRYRRDIGKADRFGGDLRGTFYDNSVRTGLGYHYLRSSSDFAVLPVASSSGSFHEARCYAMRDTKSYFAALDVIGYFFKEPVDNGKNAWEALGSLGYRLTPQVALSGDLSYGRNPQYDDELKGLVRLTYNVNLGDSK